MHTFYYNKNIYFDAGVSKIKKMIIIISVALLLVGLFFLGSFIKKQYTLQQIQEAPQQEMATEKEEEEEEENEDENTQAKKEDNTESPIKDYLYEKAEQAMDRFFTKELNVVAIGDSLTEGVGDEKNSGYVGILDDSINHDKELLEFENFGKKGNRTDQLLLRLEEEEDLEEAVDDADIILITIGANDIMQVFKENFTDLTLDKFSNETKQYEERLNTIFDTIQDYNKKADVYLIGFYNPFTRHFEDIEELETIVDEWNDIGKNTAEDRRHGHYIPIKDIFDDTENDYLSDDHFHPNHEGYQLMAERVLEHITNGEEAVANQDEEESS